MLSLSNFSPGNSDIGVLPVSKQAIRTFRTTAFKLHAVRPSAHGATEKKLTGHANYQPVTSELLPL
jgi:hypothetical protein